MTSRPEKHGCWRDPVSGDARLGEDGALVNLAIAIVVVVFHATAVILAFRSMRTARTPQGAVGWVIFLLTFPYAAVPIFLFLGHSRFPGYVSARRSSREMISSMVRSEGGPEEEQGSGPPTYVAGFERLACTPVAQGNSVRLLIDGEETFAAILAEIDRAERYVLVQSYIIRDDGLGRELQDALIRAARRGCTVRLLYDRIGCYNLPEMYLAQLRAARVACADFHSIRKAHSRFQVNFRNHRKIFIVDGVAGFLGGTNIGDEYMGRHPYYGRWRDTQLRLAGPVVAQLQLVFAEDWKWATEETLDLEWSQAEQDGGVDALVVAPAPSDDLETGSLYFCSAIAAARRRIWIASPYFVPDVDIQTALSVAAIQGIDVRILVAGKRDHWFVWLAAFAYFDEMRQAGVRFFRYKDGFMHQKVVLVDDAFAGVGSANLDNRSCRLNFEATALVFDAGFAKDVEAMLEADLSNSELYTTPLDESPSLIRYGAPVARLLAPLL